MRRARTMALLLIALSPSVCAQASAQAPAEQEAWALRLSAGLGVGTRDFDLPMDDVVYQTTTDAFPAMDLGFELQHAASRSVRLGLLVRYQSSLAHGIVEQHTDGSQHAVPARAHRVELAFTPSLALDAEGRWVLGAAIGCAVRGFRPAAHLVTPGYTLAGPHLRAELRLPIAGKLLGLRLGPEAQWIAFVGSELRARGVASQGVGLGAEATLELSLERFTIHAGYRELHSMLDSAQAQSFQDVERFVTARVSGVL